MASLSKARATPRRDGEEDVYGVKAAATIHAGSIVCLDGDGWAVPAAAAAGNVVVGRAEQTVRNTASGATDGGLTVRVRRGVFRWANSAAAACARTHIGELAYAEDDQTVRQGAGGNRPAVGRITQVDSAGVWVATDVPGANA